jgi:hypothetical protein
MSDRWLLYGRTEYAEPLTERIALELASDEVVAEAARSALSGKWVELVAIRESDVHWIVRAGEEAEGERTARARG